MLPRPSVGLRRQRISNYPDTNPVLPASHVFAFSPEITSTKAFRALRDQTFHTMTIESLRFIHTFERGLYVLSFVCALLVILAIAVLFFPSNKGKRFLMGTWMVALLLPMLAVGIHLVVVGRVRDGIRLPVKEVELVSEEKVTARTVLKLDRVSYELIRGGTDGGILPPHVNLNEIPGIEFRNRPSPAGDAPRIWLMNAEVDYLHLGLNKQGTMKPKPGRGLWIGEIEGISFKDLDDVKIGDHP